MNDNTYENIDEEFFDPTNKVSVLNQAIIKNDFDLVKEIVNNDNTILNQHYDFDYPLYYCTRYGRSEMFKYFYETMGTHLDLNVQDLFFETPLHVAVLFKQSAMIKLLIDHNANLSLLNHSRLTPYELARQENYSFWNNWQVHSILTNIWDMKDKEHDFYFQWLPRETMGDVFDLLLNIKHIPNKTFAYF